MTKTFVAEICFISNDKNDSEARSRLYRIINNPENNLVSASIEDLYEIENE
jgi:hypothetical protein